MVVRGERVREKIISFFNSAGIKGLKEISGDKLIFYLADLKIARQSGDAYFFIRICKGMGVLEEIKATKTYLIHREKLKEGAKDVQE